MIRDFLHFKPILSDGVYIDISAQVIGNVVLQQESSVWCNAVIRGDVSEIIIGKCSNIQDLTVLHASHASEFNKQSKLKIGNYVSVGHACCLHGCTISDNVLVGMKSIILDYATIGNNVLIGAGSLVPMNAKLESDSLYFGSPVKFIRKLTTKEIEQIHYNSTHYVRLHKNYVS